MKLKVALCLVLGFSLSAAAAQSGLVARRDASGNLVRDNGPYSPRGVNQGPVNNGPIRNTPAQPSATNIGTYRTNVRR
jgi:hypothetical protein